MLLAHPKGCQVAVLLGTSWVLWCGLAKTPLLTLTFPDTDFSHHAPTCDRVGCCSEGGMHGRRLAPPLLSLP